jgi:histone H3/H4
METKKPEKQAPTRSRISLDALAEVKNALRDYEAEVWEAARAREGIAESTVKTYTDGPEKFVAWLAYAFAPGPSQIGSTAPRVEIGALKIARPAAKRSRISLPAFAEAEAAFEEFVREVLCAKMGERATNQLGDHAEYFLRWLKYDFAPGARKGWRGERPKAAPGEG